LQPDLEYIAAATIIKQGGILRGFWYMLEAVIAGVIIFGFLAVIGQTYIIPQQGDFTLQAYQSLKSLDEQGILRPYAAAGDWGGLNNQVRVYSRNHTIEICDSSGSCAGQKPQGANVWAGNYIISGDQTYQPYLIKLYLW
jgi:hypothetical protein